MGLATAIPTKRNSVMISTTRKAAKCQNGCCASCQIFDFQAEYEGSIPFTRSKRFNDLVRQELFILTNCRFPF
jgi:hypothetical protein